MNKDNNPKFFKLIQKILTKLKPRFSLHYVSYTILFLMVVFSVVHLVGAATPNPGHPWSEVGDGVFTFTNGQTVTNYTYTFPAATTTVLTTNALVTPSQGGTGIGTYTIGDLIYASGTTTLTTLADVATGSCLISGGVATAPSWGTCTTGAITSLSAIGSSPNANGATITGSVLNLEPASASFGGVVTTGTQTFAGQKTISNSTTSGADLAITNTGAYTGTGIFNLTANSATSGTLALITSNSQNAGKMLDLQFSNNGVFTSHTALNILTTGSDSGSPTTYGAQISNTHSYNNIALYLNASGGTGSNPNRALVVNAGTVTVTPFSAANGVIYATSSGVLTQSGINSTGTTQCLTQVSSGVPTWGSCTTGAITTLAAIGSSPNANGATLTGSTLNLEPASASFGGVVTTGTQTFAGQKTISNSTTSGADLAITNTGAYTGTGIFNLTANSATTGTLGLINGDGLTSGSLLSLTSNGTATDNNQKGLNISLSGTNASSSKTSYGLYVSNAHLGTSANNYGTYLSATGGVSSTNIALYATASGSNTNNYAAVFPSGRVGVGLIRPFNIFQVAPVQYSTGSVSQSGTTVTLTGATWSSTVQPGTVLVFADGTKRIVDSYTDSTHIEVTVSGTVSSQSYTLNYTGLNVDDLGNVMIGSTTNPNTNSRLYINGGNNGANIDARGWPGAATDSSIIELEGSDYDTNAQSTYLMYTGVTATGTQMGYSKANLAQLVFNGDNALIYSGLNTPIMFGTNGTQRMVLSAGGNFSIGSNTTTSLFNVGSSAQFQVNSSGAIAAAAGITSSGTITFSGLGGGGIQCVQTSNTGVLSAAACGGGSSTWNGITNPTGTQTLTFDDAELNNWTMNSDTETFWTITSNSLTSGKVLSLASSSLTTGGLIDLTTTSTALTSGGLLNLQATGAPASSWTGELAKIEYNNADVDVDGSALKVGLLGAAGGEGTALNITTAQTGTNAYALRVNDDGTYTDSTPFVIDKAGSVGIGTTALSTNVLSVVGSTSFTGSGSNRFDFTNTTASSSNGVLGVNATASSDFIPGIRFSTTQTATGSLFASYGTQNFWTSAAVVTGAGVGQNAYGIYNAMTKSGADTATGTYNLFGSYNSVSNTGRTNVGTVNTYGGYFEALGDTAGTSTTTAGYFYASGADNNYAGIFDGGNVGVGDTTPASLFTVGNGDLFQINSTGQIGSQQAPVSDYLFALAGTTGNDNSRIIDITQANNADETSTGISFTGTPTLGAIAANRNISGMDITLTPSFTSNAHRPFIYGSTNTISLSSATYDATDLASVIGNNSTITGTPVINDTGGEVSLLVAGTQGSVGFTPTLTSVSTADITTFGGRFLNTVSSAGNANLQMISYGIQTSATGNLTTTGATSHYGGHFLASGTADINYGIYVTASGATNNYAAVFDQGNVGIGTTTPGSALDVKGTIRLSGATSGYVGLVSPSAPTSYTWTLPTADSSGCIQSNGSGTLSIAACGGGGLTVGTTAIASGGANRVLFEDGSNKLAENSNFTYDGTTLGVSNASTTASNKVLNISQTGATTGTDYAGYFSNTGAATTNVGLYTTASGGTTNLALNVDAGQTLLGGTTLTSGTLAKLNIVSTMASNGSTTAIAGIHGDYTFNNGGAASYVQVGNRFVFNNAPTTNANTMVGEVLRTVDNTSLANLVRGIEIVSNAGSNTAGTNTGLRSTGATFGVQAITSGLAGGVALPAGLYAENTGTTQGDVARFYTGSMTSAPSMVNIYHDTSTFTGTGLIMDMAVGSGTFSGDFMNLKNASVTKFKITNAGVVSMGLSGTASTNALCSSLANATAPTAGTAYEIRDCNAAPAADYAEMYPVEAGTEYGDIVAVGTEMVTTYDVTDGNIDWTKVKGKITKLVKSNKAYQSNIVGIVSDNHGDFTSAGHNIKEIDNPMPIALNGRVPVKVAHDSEAILPGDYLTTSSSEPGKATKAKKSGQVIGKALDTWTPDSGAPTVMVYVEQGFYNGKGVSEFAGIDPVATDFAKQVLETFMNNQQYASEGSELMLDRIAVGVEIITSKLVADTVKVNTISAATGDTVGLLLGPDGKLIINSGTTKAANPVITFDSLGNATFTGKVTAHDIEVTNLSGIQNITDQINQLSEGQAAFTLTTEVINTLSTVLTIAQADITKLKDDMGRLQSTVTGLVVRGDDLDTRMKLVESFLVRDESGVPTGIATVGLNVSGDGTFTGKTQFDGLSFFSNTTSFAGGVIFGGQTEFTLPPLYNKDTAGYALIKEGDRRAKIVFAQPYIATPVVNTSVTFEAEDEIDDTKAQALFADDIRFIIVGKDQTGFTILLNKPAIRDIRFSWNALSVKDPAIFTSVFEGLTIEPTPPPAENNTTPSGDEGTQDGNEEQNSGIGTEETQTPPENTTPPLDNGGTSSGDTPTAI